MCDVSACSRARQTTRVGEPEKHEENKNKNKNKEGEECAFVVSRGCNKTVQALRARHASKGLCSLAC